VTSLDCAVLHRVKHLETGNQLACRKCPDLKFAVSGLGNAPGQDIGGAKDRIEALAETRCQTPLDLRLILGDGGFRQARGQRCGRNRARRPA
jgi:hypothetical protein